jgi:nucleoid-associated protein YgaU
MGKFEKLVVLTVLFLSAIVLAFTLRGGGEEQKNPVQAAEKRAAGDKDASATPAFTLSSEVSRGAQPGAAQSATPRASDETKVAPAGSTAKARILRDERGLAPTGLTDLMQYTVAPGETWVMLSERFYADARYVQSLRNANEELTGELAAGARLLVPVFDAVASEASRAPFVAQAPSAAGGPATIARPAPAVELNTCTVFEVRKNDNLSKISKAVYGTANRWKEIFDANRDQLESPDWLQVGMKLKIPR